MVTFSSDYWAPGLDVNVRRRKSNKREGTELPFPEQGDLVATSSSQTANSLSAFSPG
ncbi:hypothetical protein DSO57_1022358 [Entomophthora muscae]|uniref:Uncharacterized protein n=1 Tax=Entomophthora muscae TaxID=34485 RepID=A0ACC2SSG0_9FUNG|nr:hypothetical protein DSO57_1022358 [Entomophthora muscae]